MRFAKFGSTCCNPIKIDAKLEAEKIYADEHKIEATPGKFDKKVYNDLLAKKVKALGDSRGLPSVAPSVTKPAGGAEVVW